MYIFFTLQTLIIAKETTLTNVMNMHTASIQLAVTIALAEKASLVMGGLVKVNKYLMLVISVVIGDELMTISPSFLHYLNFTYTSGKMFP